MKKSDVFFFLVLFVFPGAIAQIPPGYYDHAIGKTGQELQQALHDIIQTGISVDYYSLWSFFASTDKRPDNTVWDIYSDIPDASPPYEYHFGIDQCGSAGGAPVEDACYDREHSWPKSWFGGEVYPMYSDLFILYPTDSYVNGRRSNYPYGTVALPEWTSMNGSKLGDCTWTGYSRRVFEPIDEFKGDLARTYFYVSVRYYQDDTGWPGSDMTTGSQLKSWALAMMLKWNSQDPVSPKEIYRNNTVYSIQGNRNPFIDHPEYAGSIWGNGTGIEEAGKMKIRVFPNPAHDYCRLMSVEFNPLTNINIRSVTGVPVRLTAVADNNGIILDVHDLASGVYFITLYGPGNSGFYYTRIIKD